MAAGAGNGAIAARLGLTEKTIRNNVSSIFVKLGVADRAAAVARARDAGIRPRPLSSRTAKNAPPGNRPVEVTSVRSSGRIRKALCGVGVGSRESRAGPGSVSRPYDSQPPA